MSLLFSLRAIWFATLQTKLHNNDKYNNIHTATLLAPSRAPATCTAFDVTL